MHRALVVAAVLLGAVQLAHADGERIVRIRVIDNSKTDPSTVQDIAGVSEGDRVTLQDLERMKVRLLASGLFKEVALHTELSPAGLTLVISAKDKHSWFILPTFSYSQNAYGGGVAFGETNLFGLNKQVLLIGGMSNTTTTIAAAFRDPSVHGTWFYYQLDGFYQRDQVYEYAPVDMPNEGIKRTNILRSTLLQSTGVGLTGGIKWWRMFKTEARLSWRYASYGDVGFPDDSVAIDPALQNVQHGAVGAPAGKSPDGNNVTGRLTAGWDSRSSIHGVQHGLALLANYEQGLTGLGSDFNYWKASVNFQWALRFFEEHNLIVRANAVTTRNEPFFEEIESGGAGFRGYLTRQFRGDTRGFGSAEYVVPIIKLWGLHVRGLVFYDTNLSWFAQKPTCRGDGASDTGLACQDGYPYAERVTDGGNHIRYFLPGQYFSPGMRAWNNGVGAGLRFYLKSINMPLIGLDYGYGIEGKLNEIYLTIGAVI